MERHIKAYDIDVMTQQKIDALQPAAQPGGPVGVKLSNGAVLTAKSVVLATGARWRSVNVPGEQEYKNKGVAYCPHCDGPLFKGKRTAVIGGGNSGVEAAIDLAGIVEHVTLLEFAPQLKADAILVAKLKSLPNVTVITHAQTAAITGDGNKVSGLSYIDRTSGQTHDIAIAGVFVQIGLIPNSDFAKGVLELSAHGEIIINERCETSLPGVFAAGDVTTVPYKQIIIAAGEGAKAALSAFDHLIRTPVVQDGAVNTKADKPVSQQPLKDTASMAAS
jgi:alkyl hydroperoxide reductase subunit F